MCEVMGACEAGVGVLTRALPVVEGSASALAAAKTTAIADVKCVCSRLLRLLS